MICLCPITAHHVAASMLSSLRVYYQIKLLTHAWMHSFCVNLLHDACCRYYGVGTCGGTVRGNRTVSLIAPDGPANTIVDCYAQDDTLQTRHLNVLEGSYLRINGLSLVYGGTDLVEQGGCIFISEGSTLNIANSILANCKAQYGGGIHASQGAFVVLGGNTQLQDCTAVREGGCVHVEGSSLTVTGRTALSNCRARSAGGVSASSSMIILRDFVRFEQCRATASGGGLMMSRRSRLSVTGQVAFSSCAAGVNGGALHVSDMSSIVIFGLSSIADVREPSFLFPVTF
jgi:hypothetical protein